MLFSRLTRTARDDVGNLRGDGQPPVGAYTVSDPISGVTG